MQRGSLCALTPQSRSRASARPSGRYLADERLLRRGIGVRIILLSPRRVPETYRRSCKEEKESVSGSGSAATSPPRHCVASCTTYFGCFEAASLDRLRRTTSASLPGARSNVREMLSILENPISSHAREEGEAGKRDGRPMDVGTSTDRYSVWRELDALRCPPLPGPPT